MIHFVVDGLPKSPNQTSHSHWAVQAKEKREWTEMIGWLAKSVKTKDCPYEKAHILYKIYVGDNRRHDPDNLAFSVSKVANDALVGIIIEDDSIDNVTLEYEFYRDKPRRFEVFVSKR